MKYKEQEQLVSDLRELANFFERPESIVLPYPYGMLTSYDSVSVGKWDYSSGRGEYKVDVEASTKRIKKITKSIGSCEKNWTSTSLEVIKKLGNDIVLRWYVSREAVCKKVPTGNKIVHPAQVIPERTEEEYEWVCDDVSLLAS